MDDAGNPQEWDTFSKACQRCCPALGGEGDFQFEDNHGRSFAWIVPDTTTMQKKICFRQNGVTPVLIENYDLDVRTSFAEQQGRWGLR